MDRTKKIITLATLITMISSFVAGCGNEAATNDETTTKIEATTTVQETTTEEPTTEEPTTEYVFKGEQFAVSSSKKDLFMDLVVEKGYKIALNDIVGKDEGTDGERGGIGQDLTIALYQKNHVDKVEDFVYTYLEPGASSIRISYDQNVVIEYNEEEKMYFHFVEDNGEYVYFDVYEID